MVLFLGNSLCYLLFVFLLLLLYKSKSIIDKSFLEKKLEGWYKGGLIKFIDNKGIIIVIPTMGNRGGRVGKRGLFCKIFELKKQYKNNPDVFNHNFCYLVFLPNCSICGFVLHEHCMKVGAKFVFVKK